MKGYIAFFSIISVANTLPQYDYKVPSIIRDENPFYNGAPLSYNDASPIKTIVTKQFFIHAAPDEEDEIGADKVIHIGPKQKHYRVVFIKAPHQNVQPGRIKVISPEHQEKTVIYVLSKKPNVFDIKTEVQQSHIEPTKPDVFFIKYKTNEEAVHAQKQIQAQYDSLGGTTQISDEGVAPLTSVVGALGHSSNEENNYISPATASITGAYLPPSDIATTTAANVLKGLQIFFKKRNKK
ncbi:uncharacterized protein LOC129613849 [Condylostylus longicornis]|uniref:uncharacterized protein LOC129613849 n=1 Tax=Condylostylus longicornis TaxID=2530218 RepID=UPI00244DF378|nr:uncharacterized protein LOC129613849 [Condylostylus longicornis]